MNGKGDRNRTADWESYRRNYEEIFGGTGQDEGELPCSTNGSDADAGEGPFTGR